MAGKMAKGFMSAAPRRAQSRYGTVARRALHATVTAQCHKLGPGAKPMYDDQGFDVADDLDQATGLQHAELVADILDKPFFQEALIQGPFGTAENPVLIESTLGYRIVGCTGGEGDQEHDVAWFEMHSGQPLACDCCGQFYQLVDVAPPTVAWDATANI